MNSLARWIFPSRNCSGRRVPGSAPTPVRKGLAAQPAQAVLQQRAQAVFLWEVQSEYPGPPFGYHTKGYQTKGYQTKGYHTKGHRIQVIITMVISSWYTLN